MATSRICSIPDARKRAAYGEARRFYRETVLPYDGDECLIWPFARTKGGYANLASDYVHRKICEERHGPAPTPEHEAAHSCGKGKSGCVAKAHLSWKTHTENETDKIAHGTRNIRKPRVRKPKRSMRGSRNPNAKLTAEQVQEIRKLKGTATQREIGRIFGVSHQTVSLLLAGGSW